MLGVRKGFTWSVDQVVKMMYPLTSNGHILERDLSQISAKMPGIDFSMKYYKTDFVDAKPTDANKKKLSDASTEMLCLKEDCFDLVKKTKTYAIFKNHTDKHLGIIYDDDGIATFIKQIAKIKSKEFFVYVFSLDNSAAEEEFEEAGIQVKLKPIPAGILKVYEMLLK